MNCGKASPSGGRTFGMANVRTYGCKRMQLFSVNESVRPNSLVYIIYLIGR